ncbi:Cellulose synthase-like protein D1 [Morella rubra]|uniref:Cellulose synthase-like protein D1 n=1 Tax=Morella rubra TaxID=262757 RepID=A0A6A1URE6_9ROSI|nr:Cellulose synthase-like protein D1 [Morella rubra]
MKSMSSSSSSRPPNQAVKFARRTSSGRIVSLSRDDDLDMSGEFAVQNDYMNYTVMLPPTPDNQPGAASDSKPDGAQRRRMGDEEGGYGGNGGSGAAGGSKMDRRMSVMRSSDNKSMLLRSQTGDFDHNRWLFETKGKYGIGNAFWSEEVDDYGQDSGMSMSDFMDKPWKPLTRKLKIQAAVLSPYRLLIAIRIVVLGLFLAWRLRNPNRDAMWLWGLSIVCEVWFGFSWLLDVLPKLNPINRATDLATLRDKFEQPSASNPHGRSDLPGIDVFVSTADPEKEPPLVTANTILSILAVDYPVEKLSCYISDDGGAILTFEAMAEAVQFAEIWVPFCLKHNIEPRNPDSYFNSKTDPTKNKKRPDFVKDRRWIKREYDEFKVRINGLPEVIRKRCETYNSREETKEKKIAREKNGGVLLDPIKVTKATWMADGTHWPGTWLNPMAEHTKGDHAGILQVFTLSL